MVSTKEHSNDMSAEDREALGKIVLKQKGYIMRVPTRNSSSVFKRENSRTRSSASSSFSMQDAEENEGASTSRSCSKSNSSGSTSHSNSIHDLLYAHDDGPLARDGVATDGVERVGEALIFVSPSIGAERSVRMKSDQRRKLL